MRGRSHLGDTGSRRLRVDHVGPGAERFVGCHRDAVVEAVFARSLYLRAGDDFLCIADATLCDGPLTARLHAGAPASWIELIERGQPAKIDPPRIFIGRLQLELASARSWRPPDIGAGADARQVASATAVLRSALVPYAPTNQFLAAVIGDRSTPPSGALALAVAELAGWLDLAGRHALDATSDDARAPLRLLGLGPGLTPSGDDLLCGCLATLRGMGAVATAATLAHHVTFYAAARTSPLSRCYLLAACEGLLCEPLMQAIADLLAGDTSAFAATVVRVREVGHSSGLDALAGVLMALQAAA